MQCINYYECPNCNTKWVNRWNDIIEDDCPVCRYEMEPYFTTKIDSSDKEVWTPSGMIPIWYDDPFPDMDAKDSIDKSNTNIAEQRTIIDEIADEEDRRFLQMMRGSMISDGEPCGHPG